MNKYGLNLNFMGLKDCHDDCSCIALTISIYALRRNIRLSIQQAIFKIITDKAKDCNSQWLNEPEHEKNNPDSPHLLVMTELVITTEIVERSFSLFGKNLMSIINFKDDYYYLFYKQLTPDLRGYIQRSKQFAKILEPEGGTFTNQVARVFNKLVKHFEK